MSREEENEERPEEMDGITREEVDALEEDRSFLHGELTYRIIGTAMEVHRVLGHGFLEAVYHEALGREFTSRGLDFADEPPLGVEYKGVLLKKTFRVDFIVGNAIVVEIKAYAELKNIDISKTINYLKASGKEVALLINFGREQLEWKRLVL